MSDVIVFNTEDAVKGEKIDRVVSTFKLVGEDNPILKEVMPEWDFSNPPTNAIEFASTLVETCKAKDRKSTRLNSSH